MRGVVDLIVRVLQVLLVRMGAEEPLALALAAPERGGPVGGPTVVWDVHG